MNDISVTFFADSGKQHQFCWEIKIVSVKNIANTKRQANAGIYLGGHEFIEVW